MTLWLWFAYAARSGQKAKNKALGRTRRTPERAKRQRAVSTYIFGSVEVRSGSAISDGGISGLSA